MKTCSACGRSKSLADFNLKRSHKDGHDSRCRKCISALGKAWRAENREHVSERARKWREKNPDRAREHTRRQRDKDREAWNAAARDWYRRNKERASAYHREYQQLHPEAARKRSKEWRGRNPEYGREKVQRRRARIRGATVEPVDFRAILARDGFVCHICGGEVASQDLSFDHVTPVARGGSHTADNIRVAHGVCNSRKGSRLMAELVA